MVAALEAAKGVGDRVDLHFEGFDAQGDLASEYGAAEAEPPQLIWPAMQKAEETGLQVGTLAIGGINASSVAPARPATPDPALPPLDQVTAWRELATALHALGDVFAAWAGGAPRRRGSAVAAALAVLQAHAVVSARDTWRSGAAVENPAGETW